MGVAGGGVEFPNKRKTYFSGLEFAKLFLAMLIGGPGFPKSLVLIWGTLFYWSWGLCISAIPFPSCVCVGVCVRGRVCASVSLRACSQAVLRECRRARERACVLARMRFSKDFCKHVSRHCCK